MLKSSGDGLASARDSMSRSHVAQLAEGASLPGLFGEWVFKWAGSTVMVRVAFVHYPLAGAETTPEIGQRRLLDSFIPPVHSCLPLWR